MLLLLTLLTLVLGVLACLQCDRSIQRLHKNFISQHPEMKGISDAAFQRYEESSKKTPRIGFTSLYRAKTEYQNEFNIFLKGQTGPLETIQIMEKGRGILEKHLYKFTREDLCPNTCGLLKRKVLNCVSCRSENYTCASPTGQLDCGEIPVQADEGEQAVLDCFQSWHRLLQGKTKYHYSWAPGEPGPKKPAEGAYRRLVVMDESSIVLNQLQMKEQGTYRCSLRGQDGTLFYQVNFLLTVTPEPYQPPLAPAILPTLVPTYVDVETFPDAELLVPVIATVTAVSLAVCVGLAVMLSVQMNMWKCPAEEEEQMETSTPSSESQTTAV